MSDIHLLVELYCHPWLIQPQVHAVLCDIVRQHIAGDDPAPFHKRGGEEKTRLRSLPPMIARIPIMGMISRRVSDIQKSSGVADLADIEDALDEAVTNPDVAGILLDIDSGGGTVTGVPEMANYIRDVTHKKPTAAYTSGDMCSAAYWLGSAADLVMCSQSAHVGSIGVYSAWLDESRAMENAGIRTEIVKCGKFKGMGIKGRTMSDEEKALLQARCDEVYGWFTGFVGSQRPDVWESAMEGQSFFGSEAKENGLVDAVCSEGEAVANLLELIQMRGG